MIGEGFELMVVGMGVVFSFLVLMVLLMKVSGALLSKLPEPEPVVQKSSRAGNRQSGPSSAATTKGAKVAVALAAAYRAKHG